MSITNNPFDSQPPAPSQTGIVGGAMAGEPAAYRPASREIDSKTGTVQGQVDSILSKDGALMQRARTTANEQMASRGLLNSSMAVEAGQAAVLDRALPMAQQDAAAYNQAESENLGHINQAAQFNTGSKNTFTSQQADRDFNAKQQALAEAGTNQRQAQQLASTEKLQGLELAQRDSQFKSAQDASFKQQTIEHANQLETLGVQNNFALAQVPQQFAAGLAASTTDRVNAILGDPNLKPEAKKIAVENATTYANSTLAWAEKLYNVDLPNTIGIAPAPAPAPGAAPAPAPTAPVVKTATTQPVFQWQPTDTYYERN